MAVTVTRHVYVDGLALRSARHAAGLSQAALAGRVGITQPTLSDWEAKRAARMDRGCLRDLARALRCTQRELIADEPAA